MKPSIPIEDRFWKYVNIDGEIPQHAPHLGRCWNWTGSLDTRGYGSIGSFDKTMRAHRVAYELAFGKLPERVGHHGTVVMHRCDNRRCVNFLHLKIGSQRDNMQDRSSKGRDAMYKLKFGDRELIKELVALGEKKSSVAKKFGISKSRVSQIVRNNEVSSCKQ